MMSMTVELLSTHAEITYVLCVVLSQNIYKKRNGSNLLTTHHSPEYTMTMTLSCCPKGCRQLPERGIRYFARSFSKSPSRATRNRLQGGHQWPQLSGRCRSGPGESRSARIIMRPQGFHRCIMQRPGSGTAGPVTAVGTGRGCPVGSGPGRGVPCPLRAPSLCPSIRICWETSFVLCR